MELRVDVKLIPIDKISLYKISSLIWDVLIDQQRVDNLPTEVKGKQEMWIHGLHIVKNPNEEVRIYSTAGKRFIQIRNIYLLTILFEKINERSDIPIAILPLEMWKKKHVKY